MFGVNIDDIKGEKDPEKLRSAAIDLARRNMTLEAENIVLLRRVMDVTEELAIVRIGTGRLPSTSS